MQMKRIKWRYCLLALLTLALIAFLWLCRAALLPFLLAALFAYLLDPLRQRLQRLGMGSTAAVLLIYGVLAALLLALLLWGLPRLSKELLGLGDALPAYVDELEGWMDGLQRRWERLAIPEVLRQSLDELMRSCQERLLQKLQALGERLFSLGSNAAILLLTPVLAFYMLRDRKKIGALAVELIPERIRPALDTLLIDVNRLLRKFVRGYFLLSLIIGAMVTLGLWALQVDFPILLGAFAGLMEFIPYFGPFIGALPAVLFALLASGKKALWTAVLLLAIQEIENLYLTPRIIGDSVGLHPLSILLALLLGGELAGFWGFLFGVPVAAVLKVSAVFVYSRFVALQEKAGEKEGIP